VLVRVFLPIVLILLMAAVGPADEVERPTPPEERATLLERAEALQAEIAAMIERVRPTVVAIHAWGKDDEDGTPRNAVGSGVIVSPEGYVLTNHHVVGWAEGVRVIRGGSRARTAKIVGRDEDGDLALLQVEGSAEAGPWPVVEFGDSESLRPGQWVFALGNPRTLSADGRLVVTWGSVTALHCLGGGRKGGQYFYGDAIQTDAELNPGNSGGALFDTKGRLVGLNGRIATGRTSGDGAVNANVGFAIPASQILRFLPLLRRGEPIRHGYLGVRVERDDGDRSDVRVVHVLPGTAAARAGVRPGDRLLAVDGLPVDSEIRLTNIVSSWPAGAKVALRLARDGRERIVIATLGVRPVEEE
jgi:serine protease Do